MAAGSSHSRKTDNVTDVRPTDESSAAAAAAWLLPSAQADWATFVRFGPPGFDCYVRVPFAAADDPGEADAMADVLALLATASTTPDEAYAAVWEGWVGGGTMPDAPRLDVLNRMMLLFTGSVTALRHAPSLAWFGDTGHWAEPHLLWPADRAWLVACDVDEEIGFTVGCSRERATRLQQHGAREVAYGSPVPMYRDEP